MPAAAAWSTWVIPISWQQDSDSTQEELDSVVEESKRNANVSGPRKRTWSLKVQQIAAIKILGRPRQIRDHHRVELAVSVFQRRE